MKTNSHSRLFYIDNLRIFLISLVVLHHLAITYGAPGGWYYNESQAEFPLIIPMSMFVASNQAFFMGMFFFISALFVVPSLLRKGTKKYVTDRLIRLAIPLVVFYFLLSPLAVYILVRFIQHENIGFLDVLKNGWGRNFGPLWFVEALLLFTAVYLLIRKLLPVVKIRFPGTPAIIITALLIGFLQFLIRLWHPVGWSMPYTDFQLPFFLQYIALFILGIIAWQNNWLDAITPKMGRNWFIFAQVLILVIFPVMAYFGGHEKGAEVFMGGLLWQSFAYATWEQLLCVSMILGLLGLSKKWLNQQGKTAAQLSAGAYGVFVIHTPILVGLSALFLSWHAPQWQKFLVLAPIALLACFLLAWLLKQIPGVKKVL